MGVWVAGTVNGRGEGGSCRGGGKNQMCPSILEKEVCSSDNHGGQQKAGPSQGLKKHILRSCGISTELHTKVNGLVVSGGEPLEIITGRPHREGSDEAKI